MANVKVRSRVPDYSGAVGPVQFANGEATFDPKEHPGVLGYFLGAGYDVEGYTTRDDPPGLYEPRPTPVMAAPGTPDNPTGIVAGTTSRDAAIETDAAGPWSDAFLPPTNAGKADPHGPLVVSPGLHAVPPAPIVPGPVYTGDEVAEQEARETAVAEATLVRGVPVPAVMGAVEREFRGRVDASGRPNIVGAAGKVDADTTLDETGGDGPDTTPAGELGLSDPASAQVGRLDAEESDVPSAADLREQADARSNTPAKRATVGEWRDYAVAQGATREDADGMTKEQLLERYGQG